PLAHDLGQTGDTRVTFIRADGVVLGDSALSAADVTRMENHATRPEVEEALENGLGSSERVSVSLHQPMLYVAVPFQRDGSVAGVVRVSEPLSTVDSAKSEVHRLMWM